MSTWIETGFQVWSFQPEVLITFVSPAGQRSKFSMFEVEQFEQFNMTVELAFLLTAEIYCTRYMVKSDLDFCREYFRAYNVSG